MTQENSCLISQYIKLIPNLLERSVSYDQMLSKFMKSYDDDLRAFQLQQHGFTQSQKLSIENEFEQRKLALKRIQQHNVGIITEYSAIITKYEDCVQQSDTLIDRGNRALHFIRFAHPLFFKHKKYPLSFNRPKLLPPNFTSSSRDNSGEFLTASAKNKQKNVRFITSQILKELNNCNTGKFKSMSPFV